MDRPEALTDRERPPRFRMRTFPADRPFSRAPSVVSLPETGYLGDNESSESLRVIRVPQDAAGDTKYPQAFEALRRALIPSLSDEPPNVPELNRRQKVATAPRKTVNQRRRRRRRNVNHRAAPSREGAPS